MVVAIAAVVVGQGDGPSIEGVTKFLTSAVILLFDSKHLQDEGVPFILKGLQENGNGRGGAAFGTRYQCIQRVCGSRDTPAFMIRGSASSSFLPVRGPMLSLLMYLRMRRHS